MRQWFFRGAAILLAGIVLFYIQRPVEKTGGSTFSLSVTGESVLHPTLLEAGLPDTVRPIEYVLRLTVDPSASYFVGQAEIALRLTQATDTLWMRGHDIELRDAAVHVAGGEAVPADPFVTGKNDLVRLKPRKSLQPGEVKLVITYRAPFDDRGLLRHEDNGQSHVVTSIGPLAARRIFPVFDEPQFQTPYTLVLRMPEGYHAVGNASVSQERPVGDREQVVLFQKSGPLPSDGLGFAIGPFEEKQSLSLRATSRRPSPLKLQQYQLRGFAGTPPVSLQGIASVIEGMEGYFGNAYPGHKIDLVIVPGIQRPVLSANGVIFVDAQQVPVHDLYAAVARHWISGSVHQADWRDHALHEAIARYVALKVMARPELIEEVTVSQSYLQTDVDDYLYAAATWRPQPDATSMEMDQNSRRLASLLFMLDQHLGERQLQTVIRHYLENRRNGPSPDLTFADAISSVQREESAEKIMLSFLETARIPHVDLDWTCREGRGVNVTATQRPFTPLGPWLPEGQARWNIPLCLRAFGDDASGEPQCVVLQRPNQTFYMRRLTCPAALLPDANGRGHYFWSLPHDKREVLLGSGYPLTASERMSAGQSLRAEFHQGTIQLPRFLESVRALLVVDDRLHDVFFSDIRMIALELAPNLHRRTALLLEEIIASYRARLLAGAETNPDVWQFFAFDLRDEEVAAQLRQQSLPGLQSLRAELDRAVPPLSDRLATMLSEEMGGDALVAEFHSVFLLREYHGTFWAWVKENVENLRPRLSQSSLRSLLDLAPGICDEAGRSALASLYAAGTLADDVLQPRLETALARIDHCLALAEHYGRKPAASRPPAGDQKEDAQNETAAPVVEPAPQQNPDEDRRVDG